MLFSQDIRRLGDVACCSVKISEDQRCGVLFSQDIRRLEMWRAVQSIYQKTRDVGCCSVKLDIRIPCRDVASCSVKISEDYIKM